MPTIRHPLSRLGAGITISALVVLVFSRIGVGATPATVSVNFVGGGSSMSSSESAGVVAKTRWNNLTGSSRSTPLALTDEYGAASGVSVTWRADGTNSTSITDSAGNRRMMKGYLNNSSGQATTVSVAGLASGWSYAVYVYTDGNTSSTRTGIYQISGTGVTTTTINATDNANTDFSGTFVQANNTAGNYVKFTISGVTGFTLTATPGSSTSSTRRAPVNGLQIVPTSAIASDFSVSATPSSGSVSAGSSRTYTVTVGALNGFSGVVNFGVTGLPAGASVSFSPSTVTQAGPTTLTVTTSGSTPTGSSTLKITGTSSSLSHSINVTLTVTPAPDFSVSVTPGSGSVAAGSSRNYTVTVGASNGFAGTVSFNVTGFPTGASVSFNPATITQSGSTTLKVTTSTVTPTGSSTLRITGTSGARTHAANVTLTVTPAPDFSVSVSPASRSVIPGGATTYAVSVSALNGFTGTVALGAGGLSADVGATFNPPSITTSGTSTLTVTTSASTQASTQMLTVTGTSGAVAHSSNASLIVTQPDFSISASPTSRTIGPGGSATYSVSITALSGFTGTVVLDAPGLPAGATYGFSPASVTGSGTSILTITTGADAPIGSQQINVTGTSGTLVHTATPTLVVTTFSISGTITPTSIGAGATVNLSGTSTATVTADSTGAFAFTGVIDGPYTVTPQKAGYTFTPSSRNVTVADANVTGANFSGTVITYSISGTIAPIAAGNGAKVALSGAATKTATADASGNYSFTGLSVGTYTVTPTNLDYVFTPTPATVDIVDANIPDVNYTGAPPDVPVPLGPTGSWTVTFRDEFEGNLLDRAVWATTYNGGGRTNNDELEWYTDDDSTHIVADGSLKLTAYKQSSQAGFPYTSGIISSHNSFVQMYGYFEARMKLPAGRGFWPAFWLLPVTAWPPEIDSMENLGHDCTTVYMSNHWSVNWPNGVAGNQAGSSTIPYTGANYCSGFHTYGVEWTSTTIDFYIDGVRRARITDHVPVANNAWDGMVLIANLAVGGSWPGSPDASTVFPSALDIDYIRVWRR